MKEKMRLARIMEESRIKLSDTSIMDDNCSKCFINKKKEINNHSNRGD